MHKPVLNFAGLIAKYDKASVIFRLIRRMYLLLGDAIDDRLVATHPSKEDGLDLLKISTTTRNIHFVGNSHAHSFTGSFLGKFGKGERVVPFWDSFSLGPMSSIDLLGRKWETFLEIVKSQSFEKGDTLIFPFGETETRWYALKRIDPLQLEALSKDDLQTLLQPYLEASFEVYRRALDLGFNVAVWSGHISAALQPREDLYIPIYGNVKIRQEISWMWRNDSKHFAEQNGLKFLDFLPLQVKASAENQVAFLVDEVHLDDKILLGYLLNSLIK